MNEKHKLYRQRYKEERFKWFFAKNYVLVCGIKWIFKESVYNWMNYISIHYAIE